MKNKPILRQILIPVLKDIEAIFTNFSIDFYLVGAIARDYHLSASAHAQATRKTDDIDIAIMLSDAGQFNLIKAALIESGKFHPDPVEQIKLFHSSGFEIDLLPFGEIESPGGFVFLQPPNNFTLNMPGFNELYPFVERAVFEDGYVVKVCPVEGIVMLKLISYRDRPERTKDITDIEHIFDVYFSISDENIYDDYFDVMDKYSIDDSAYFRYVSARVIGRKMQPILKSSEKLNNLIKNILVKRYEDWAEPLLAGILD